MRPIILYFSMEGHQIGGRPDRRGPELPRPRNQAQEEHQAGAFDLFPADASMMGTSLELAEPLPDLSTYGPIFVGFPVWAGSPAAPVNVVLQSDYLRGKEVALFACANGPANKALIKAQNYLPKDTQVIGELPVSLSEHSQPDTLAQRIEDWLGEIILN